MTLPPVNQNKNAIALDPNFSTTRLVMREKPVIINDPSSKVQSVLFLPPNPERRGEGGLRTKGYFKKSYDEESDLSGNLPLPLVTIITVVFNGEKYLEQTIQSVINQNYDNVEYVIIDGGSTDGTVDIIRKYEDKIDYWVSEPDGGLYYAMNKGIQLATGELIGLINSDDMYNDGTVSKVTDQYVNPQKLRFVIISGSIFRTDSQGNIKIRLYTSHKSLEEKIEWRMPLHHPATFVSCDVYKTIGAFNTKYKIAGDYDFIYRAFHSRKVKFLIIDDFLTSMRLGGLSEEGIMSIWIKAKESFQVRKDNISLAKNFLIFVFVLLVNGIKQIVKPLLSDTLLSTYYRYRHTRD
ncbi:glycosyltransferase family 2 protein [Microcystis aeruginosa]|jgi:glycosyltransferase involved in cell wall biosynthesis|uniref:glycosyltransferase family 2 protein n=1 Tax=Microcystis aeruginosa TaxID=1126 RepID=UPI000261D0DC|nr:glycosyltransferase family 2 protein [Microcystis aeruginosa]CCI08774.1 Genome sequencing data, contig C317 (modular protein) [Microcystis aeruginosa PCC 7941]